MTEPANLAPVELRDVMGELVHTAFRKGAEGPEGRAIWQAIRDMPFDQWEAAVSWMVYAIEATYGTLYAERRATGGEE